MRQDILEGNYFSTTLGKVVPYHSQEIITIILIGEETGTLHSSLIQAMEMIEKKKKLKQTITSAFIYPAIIVVGTIALTCFLLLYIFPKIKTLIVSLKVPLPWTTKVLLSISQGIEKYGIIILFVAFGVIILFYLLIRKNERAKTLKDSFVITLPVIGNIIKKYQAGIIFRNSGLAMKSGMTLDGSLLVLSQTIKNTVYQKNVRQIQNNISHGYSISETFSHSKNLYPGFAIELIASGEIAGTLPAVFIHIADEYTEDIQVMMKRFSQLLEPILMIIMGLMVGFVSLSIISPLYALTQNIR